MLRKILFLIFFLPSISNAQVPFYNQFNHQEVSSFLKQFISPGDLVFDVGANIGKKTELYVELGARVVCFEPQAECIDILKRKFCKVPNKVFIEQVGLADKEGILEFYQCSAANTISTFSQDWTRTGRFAERNHRWDKKKQIAVTTLDSMIKKYGMPKFCKIDVEDFEYEVIRGLHYQIPYLSFECNIESIEKTRKCIEHLESLGYCQFNFAMGERGWFFFDQWLDGKTFVDKLLAEKGKQQYEDIWGVWGDVYARCN